MKGRVAVLDDLIGVKPKASQVLTDREEIVLHLCVKHNRFDAPKLLLKREEPIQKDDFHNGNTILQLAVAKKQIEVPPTTTYLYIMI
uniref:Uncharacterized protein n=1 Tax=Nelumbo nucifera TaxID=4432 RepID=A0A822YZW0_NELNU|nr:TPA_asm: hypothetical protein HUJ06_013957 [Nelumbo nucifera]